MSLSVFEVLVRVIPIALEIVPLVERLFRQTSGEEKRQIAVELIKPAVRAVETAANRELVDEDALQESAGKAVDGVVGILNTTGVFKKATPE